MNDRDRRDENNNKCRTLNRYRAMQKSKVHNLKQMLWKS